MFKGDDFLLTNIIPATLAFLATDIDDLFLLVTFLMVARNEEPVQQRKDIAKVFIGQILSYATIVLAADLGSLGVHLLPTRFIAGLGAIPLFMGLQIFWSEHETKRKKQKKTISNHVVSIWFVFLTFVADGGDNLGVYIPIFQP